MTADEKRFHELCQIVQWQPDLDAMFSPYAESIAAAEAQVAEAQEKLDRIKGEAEARRQRYDEARAELIALAKRMDA